MTQDRPPTQDSPHPQPGPTGVPTLVRTRAELASALAAQDASVPTPSDPDGSGTLPAPAFPTPAQPGRAVVMTMGALHAGHLALVGAARSSARHVVVTIFVNPLQFGGGEDLERYPRDLDRDLALLTAPGLLGAGDIVFAPGPDVVYPDGDPVVRVSPGPLGDVLEGVARPGHLDGVLTVVLKLLHLTRPDVAWFGQKDAQQAAAVQRMVRDLDVPVDVRVGATVRDGDGLALSSRNAYLSDAGRRRALALHRAGDAAARAAASGATTTRALAAARAELADVDVDVEYAELVDPVTFMPATDGDPGARALLVVAARVGTTRLIDNGWVTFGGSARLPTQDTEVAR